MFYEHRSQPVSFVRKVGEFLSVAVFFRAVHDQCFFGRRGQSDSESEKNVFDAKICQSFSFATTRSVWLKLLKNTGFYQI